MNPEDDSSQYYIEDTLLLRYLITRFTEMLGSDEPKLDPIWAGLGLTGLHQNRDLESAFNILISSDSYTVEDVLNISIDLFVVELQRLETTAKDTAHYVEKEIQRRPLTPRTARKFLFWSWREGRKMSKAQDFRFYPIWEVVSRLALNSEEYIKAFEQRCRFSTFPQEMKIYQGLPIIKAAIFRRRIDNGFFYPTCSRPEPHNDKETQQ